MAKKAEHIAPGTKYYRLEIVHEVFSIGQLRRFACKCQCGNEVTVLFQNLKRGATRSCGCYHKEQIKKAKPSLRSENFQFKNHRLYPIWSDMKRRCNNPSYHAFKYYGAKGIKVCDEWKNRFLNFYTWAMDNGYTDLLTIERKCVNGDYCPENCKWIPLKEQNSNKNNSRKITIGEETLTISEWAKIKGIPIQTLFGRLNRGWDSNHAIETPIDLRFSKRRLLCS